MFADHFLHFAATTKNQENVFCFKDCSELSLLKTMQMLKGQKISEADYNEKSS